MLSRTRLGTGTGTVGPCRCPLSRIVATGLAAVALVALPPVTNAPSASAISGGSPASPGDFPFVAEVRNTAANGLCTGSLIHPSWVLTAVHCSVPASVGDMTVRVGNTTSAAGGQLRRVIRVLRNPSYVGGANDVALLELDTPITNIAPVRLAEPGSAYLWDGTQGGPFTPFDQGIAVGWGRTDAGSLPTQLRYAGLHIIAPTFDASGLRRIEVDRGPCPGDSGGPLLVDVDGEYRQAGVVKAASCGASGWYSEVGAGPNRDWITSQVTRLPYTPMGLRDWDGDGHVDIVTRAQSTGDLWLYPGDSRRGYSAIPRVAIGNGWNGYTSFGVADWDRDGLRDIIVRRDDTGDLWLYPGEGRRAPTVTPRVRIGSGWKGYQPFGIIDWDRDGHQDILARQDATGILRLFPGLGPRRYGAPVLLGLAWNAVTPMGVGDWDRDGKPDLVVRDNDSGDLRLFAGQATRSMPGPSFRIGNGWNGYTPFGMADYDGDGHQDLVVRHDASGDLWLYPGESRRVPTVTPRVKVGNGW